MDGFEEPDLCTSVGVLDIRRQWTPAGDDITERLSVTQLLRLPRAMAVYFSSPVASELASTNAATLLPGPFHVDSHLPAQVIDPEFT